MTATPKSRARAIIKRYLEKPGATLEIDIFEAIVKEIEAENEACANIVRAFEAEHYETMESWHRLKVDNYGMPLGEVAELIAEKITARMK